MPSQSARSLEDIVGKETYQVWVEMLRQLVPDGRTHRLCVLVASMLQYALAKVEERNKGNLKKGSVARSLVNANEMAPDEIKAELHDVVSRLFYDADVAFDRVSKRGEHYSIADEAYREFFSWFDYPWD